MQKSVVHPFPFPSIDSHFISGFNLLPLQLCALNEETAVGESSGR